MIGTKLAHYDVTALLGSGGFGDVYQATDSKLGRSVAIKLLPEAFTHDAERVARFQREARVLASLNHPNIAAIYGIEQSGERKFLVMELVPGETLAERIKRGPLPVDEALTIAKQIAEALVYAHNKGVTHRDLKPANIMIVGREQVKVLDFGLAKIAPPLQHGSQLPTADETSPGLMLGTIQYMSPEQALGYTVDSRSDLFSVGIVFYEMVTGRRPFSGATAMETINHIINTEPAAVARLNSNVPAWLEGIINKCLEKSADRRFETASDLLRDLKKQAFAPDSSSWRSRTPNNQLTRFIGRQREIAEVQRLLTETRLLTLTGSGGVGKTRLTLQVTTLLLSEYRDGVCFVDLAPLLDATLLPQTVASLLGLRQDAGRSIADTLVDFLEQKKLLLVLDNCEHLIAACAELAETLLGTSPKLKVVATSREPLGIAGETVFRVPSLVVPDPHQLAIEGLNQCEAVQLFIDRARSVQPGFAVTTQNARALVQICIRLDGIPLAIELAASRTRVLSVDQILARLEDRLGLLTGGSRTAPVRHQTLRAAIDWSHHLLSEAERILFRRLSVFAGVWTLEAAEAVCADNGLEQREVLDLLSGLVDKSLVLAEEQDGQQRYHFLATLKQYSQEQLVQKAGAEGMLRRHAEFFLALAEEAEPKLEGPAQRIWLDRLSADYDNIRAALKWALENDADVGLRLAGALGPFWQFRGYWDEGRKGLTAVLKQSDSSSANTPSRGKVLIAVGWMASQQSDDVSARSYAEEALTIYRELGDKRGISRALTVLGHVAQRGSDLTLARSLYEESLAIRWEVGDKREIAVGLNNLGLTEHDRAAARSLHEESLAIRREVGDKRGIAISLDNLGFLARKQGDYTTARSLHEESLTIHRELGNKRGITNSLDLLGILARKQGDYMTARSLHEESLTIHRELGDKRSIAASLHNQGIAAQRQGDYTLARTLYGESLNIAQELGDSAYIAASFESLASLAVSLGQNERAVRLWGAKQALCDMASFTQRPWEFDDSDTGGMDTAREALDKEVFAAAWVQGKTMTRDHSVAYALQKDEGASGLRFGITVNKAQPR